MEFSDLTIAGRRWREAGRRRRLEVRHTPLVFSCHCGVLPTGLSPFTLARSSVVVSLHLFFILSTFRLVTEDR